MTRLSLQAVLIFWDVFLNYFCPFSYFLHPFASSKKTRFPSLCIHLRPSWYEKWRVCRGTDYIHLFPRRDQWEKCQIQQGRNFSSFPLGPIMSFKINFSQEIKRRKRKNFCLPHCGKIRYYYVQKFLHFLGYLNSLFFCAKLHGHSFTWILGQKCNFVTVCSVSTVRRPHYPYY